MRIIQFLKDRRGPRMANLFTAMMNTFVVALIIGLLTKDQIHFSVGGGVIAAVGSYLIAKGPKPPLWLYVLGTAVATAVGAAPAIVITLAAAPR